MTSKLFGCGIWKWSNTGKPVRRGWIDPSILWGFYLNHVYFSGVATNWKKYASGVNWWQFTCLEPGMDFFSHGMPMFFCINPMFVSETRCVFAKSWFVVAIQGPCLFLKSNFANGWISTFHRQLAPFYSYTFVTVTRLHVCYVESATFVKNVFSMFVTELSTSSTTLW